MSDDVIPGNYQPPPPGTSKEDLLSRPQNQVGLIVVCQMRNPNSNPDSSPNPDYQISTPSIIDLPEIIISTTHLKVSKFIIY